MQARVRGRAARLAAARAEVAALMAEAAAEEEIRVKSATKIQAVHRGKVRELSSSPGGSNHLHQHRLVRAE